MSSVPRIGHFVNPVSINLEEPNKYKKVVAVFVKAIPFLIAYVVFAALNAGVDLYNRVKFGPVSANQAPQASAKPVESPRKTSPSARAFMLPLKKPSTSPLGLNYFRQG